MTVGSETREASSFRFVVDFDSPVPVYRQIHQAVVEGIADGRLPEGARLPSSRRLASDLAIHYHTVNKAYDLLRREGFLALTRRKELRVLRPHVGDREGFLRDWSGRQETLLSEALAHGLTPPEVESRLRELLVRRGARHPGTARSGA